jgi:hypothetical protein
MNLRRQHLLGTAAMGLLVAAAAGLGSAACSVVNAPEGPTSQGGAGAGCS